MLLEPTQGTHTTPEPAHDTWTYHDTGPNAQHRTQHTTEVAHDTQTNTRHRNQDIPKIPKHSTLIHAGSLTQTTTIKSWVKAELE